jgi:hypothetical protein
LVLIVAFRCSFCRDFLDRGAGAGLVDDGLVLGVGGQQ